MGKSFRMILEERMNPREAAPRAAFVESVTIPSNQNLFASITWTPRAQVKPRTAYAAEKIRSRESARLARRPVAEPLIPLVKLSNDDLNLVRGLIELGAYDLETGLSERRLKTAYRRLARQFHPDVTTSGSHETFVKVRDLYARLRPRLTAY